MKLQELKYIIYLHKKGKRQKERLKKYITEGKDVFWISKKLCMPIKRVEQLAKNLSVVSNFWFLMLKENEIKNLKRAIVIDTCSLGNRKAIQIIEKASKVILLETTLLEIERLEKTISKKSIMNSYETYLIENIKRVSIEATRTHNDKYIVISNEKVDDYNDTNIISFCKGRGYLSLLTEDRKLALRARAKGIRVILVEKEFVLEKDRTGNLLKQYEFIGQKEEKIEDGVTIPKITLKDKNVLTLDYSSWNKKGYIVEKSNGRIVESSDFGKNKKIILDVGDKVYSIWCQSSTCEIKKYVILSTMTSPYAKCTLDKKIRYINEMYTGVINAELSEAVKLIVKERMTG